MNKVLFSIVIPAYNNAQYLPDAINSVLQQTYPNFELIVVNDASPDNAEEVIQSFTDPRVRYIKHEVNKGLSEARNTGILHSVGDFIALLDGDDYFHREKLREHAEFLDQNKGVAVTYNPRYELNHSTTTIRSLWRPPLTVDLASLILGYPFSPSDMVVRRSCMFKVGLFDQSHTYYGEDLDINCKLALEGCKFASVNRALNYRRYHSRRMVENLRVYREDELRPLYKAFADPRFPSSLYTLKDKALSNRYITWSIFAFLQNDSAVGQESLLKAVELDPSIVSGRSCEFLEQVLHFCVMDDSLDHASLMDQLMSQLPDELKFLVDQAEWMKYQGYLIRATRAVMWDRRQDGEEYFERAASFPYKIDRAFLKRLSADLLSYETELGTEAARLALKNLSPYLQKLGGSENVNWLKGHISVNRGFSEYALQDYDKVPSAILQAVVHDPTYLLNRGVVKIFLDSLVKNIHQAGT